MRRALASKVHTALPRNCYTKLNDVGRLNVFIKSEGGFGGHIFDVETARGLTLLVELSVSCSGNELQSS
ncbi:hypothetical protein ACFX1Z_045270 [Malus domestica]